MTRDGTPPTTPHAPRSTPNHAAPAQRHLHHAAPRHAAPAHARSVVEIHPDRIHVHRAPVLVVSRVLDVLDGGRDLCERKMRYLYAVIELDDVLGPVPAERPVAEEESESARGQIVPMILGQPIDDVGDAEPIVPP